MDKWIMALLMCIISIVIVVIISLIAYKIAMKFKLIGFTATIVCSIVIINAYLFYWMPAMVVWAKQFIR